MEDFKIKLICCFLDAVMFFFITKEQYILIFYFVSISSSQKYCFVTEMRNCLKIDIDMNSGNCFGYYLRNTFKRAQTVFKL